MHREICHHLQELELYWIHDGEETNIGRCWHHLIPRVGEILRHHTQWGTVWEVVQVYYGTVEPGSRVYQQWLLGNPHPGGMVELFVKPTTGPHLP